MDEAAQKEMLRLFGEYRAAQSSLDLETKRNVENIDVFEAMIRETYDGVTGVIAGHHIMFTREGHPLPYEIASADTLIFNHEIAVEVWKDQAPLVLTTLALEPVASRDVLLRKLFSERQENGT